LQPKVKRIKEATALLDRMQAESPAELERVLRRYVDLDP
jgi:hypothetical protein